MLENPMLIDSYWNDEEDISIDDCRLDLLEEFAEEEAFLPDAVALWLMADKADEYACEIVYSNMPKKYQEEILKRYIEKNHLFSRFVSWFKNRRAEGVY